MTSREYILEIPSQTDNLEIVRDFVSKIARRSGLSEDEAGVIQLAVDEACSNVIRHAYKNDGKFHLKVKAKISDKKVSFTIVDHGNSFNPDKIEKPDLKKFIAERRTGGYGTYLIRKIMDEVEYDVQPGQKNEVILTKHLK